jgi:simple sugar transport system permease protein
MDFDVNMLSNLLYAMVRTGTPLLLIALGEMVCEKSGVLNLGQEGMLLMGAVAGFIAALTSGSLIIGVLAAILVGILMSLLFGLIAINLNANQVATGLALTIFGIGLSAFVGSSYVGQPLKGFEPINMGELTDIPIIGKMLFGQDALVYLSFLLFLGVYWFFRWSRAGLVVKAVGENPHAAEAIGLPVIKTRYLAVMFGGGMAGLAGAYLSLAYTPMWVEGMSAGKGWIGLALVVFASWQTGRVLFGAYLFGLMSILNLVVQGLGFNISANLLNILPYLATIVVLVFLSMNQQRIKMYAPASLGKPFHRSR